MTFVRAPRSRLALLSATSLVVAAVSVVSPAPPAAAAGLSITTAADVVADDGLCSLREAIGAANTDTAPGGSLGECTAGSGTDVIMFSVPGPFVLAAGELLVDSAMTVGGGTGVVIDADRSSRVFRVGASGVLTLESVTVSGGRAAPLDGGGVLNEGGVLTVAGSTITGNTANDGGGIFNLGGEVNVSGSTVSTNTSVGGGFLDDHLGGGIANKDGTVTVTGSSIVNNSGDGGIGGGGGIYSDGGTVTITDSTIADNAAPSVWGAGGAVWAPDGTLTVTGSTVLGNVSSSTNGALDLAGGSPFLTGDLTLVDSDVVGNTGSGIRSGRVTVSDSALSGNTFYGILLEATEPSSVTDSTVAGNGSTGITGSGPLALLRATVTGNGGGGLWAGSGSSVSASLIADNVGLLGGGIFHQGELTVSASTISGNTADAGGGIMSFGGELTISNSTISGNFATFGGGGVLSSRFMGRGSLDVAFSTITENSAPDAAGISADPFLEATVAASIVAHNTGGGGDIDGTYTSGGYNVIGDGSGAGDFTAPGDVTGVAPGLRALGDNGGPTQTHALAKGSAAIDRVTATVTGDIPDDQRGLPRPQGPAKDAGAFELEPTLFPGIAAVLEGDSGAVVVDVPITLSSPLATPVTVEWTTADTAAPGIATEDVDFAAASGVVTFPPWTTTATVPITVHGDELVEPPAWLGEWGLVRFSNPGGAALDTSFFGLGIFIIVDDD